MVAFLVTIGFIIFVCIMGKMDEKEGYEGENHSMIGIAIGIVFLIIVLIAFGAAFKE